MRFSKSILLLGIICVLSACSVMHCDKEPVANLPGTNTAVVGVYLDQNGYPRTNVESVEVHPGQRVVFVGPDKFDIVFKDQKSPNGKIENSSSEGIVVVDIPKDILQRQSVAPIRELIYRYGIRANGKITDPSIHITPQ